MNTFREVCAFIEKYLPKNASLLETGCMYTLSENNGVHNTTINLANVAANLDGRLFSFDINKNHIDFARSCVKYIKADVRFYLGDSADSLQDPRFKGYRVDVACFDSKEFDRNHMVKEYTAVAPILSKKHYILVDDIHNEGSVKYKNLVPILKEAGYSWCEISTPTGLFVATKGYPLPIGDDSVSTS